MCAHTCAPVSLHDCVTYGCLRVDNCKYTRVCFIQGMPCLYPLTIPGHCVVIMKSVAPINEHMI